MKRFLWVIAFIIVGCSEKVTISVPPGAGKDLQKALITVQPGTEVQLQEGVYEFSKRLTLDVENITITGQGPKKTILSFKKQKVGAEGFLVTKGKFKIRNLAIEDSVGDALKIKGAKDIHIDSIRVEWLGEVKESNGAYGLYPVECENIVIKNCFVRGASDAGIYVGQSKNIIVTNNHVVENVAGIEIENSTKADVYKNKVHNNTGGILVFDLPNLPVQGGSRVRVFHNDLQNNNHKNFAAKGTVVANVSPGTGVMVMANDYVEIFENQIQGHNTVSIAIVSYFVLNKKWKDEAYDPFPQAIFVHHNKIFGGGTKPSGTLAELIAPLFSRMPDILWDGMVNIQKYPNGKLPRSIGIFIENNGHATFGNFNLRGLPEGKPKVSTDIKVHRGKMPALPPVRVKGF
ncbi:parallel beta-helix domain-containing protein [Candidatus Uabimicrobium amorphum]|uniref:Right handed beta helix domain-containing protein n=1 Tax=Uabimicrobium amorphum TaxID=2596890 RepID=A0A5S9F2C0_UABAM|nr:parallel beta-helix domain-containing protein [Candidatus Uabimicrobium amorphum]BBM82953.1 hypothetical protein UABAM_01296 [Candidatus Uabimicrobium amorphum]